MPDHLLIPLLIAAVIAVLAAIGVVAAPRLSVVARILVGIVLAPIALFCVFGFLAAMEPGNYHVFWRAGYIALFLLCVLAIARLALAPLSQQNVDEEPGE